MARLNLSELKVQSFVTGGQKRMPAPASLNSWNPTECACSVPLGACTADCVWESRRTDDMACCG